MANCSQCQAPLKTGAKFCSECGTPVESAELRCPACDQPVSSNVKFCPHCGHNLTQKVVHEDVQELAAEHEPTRMGRNWKAFALPLIIIPIFVLIALLLTRRNQAIEPTAGNTSSTNAMASGQGEQGMQMMEKVRSQVTALQDALKTNPQDTSAMASLAQMYEIAGRFDTATDYYTQYLKLYPDTPTIEMALANAHFRQGHYDEALQVVNALLKRRPENELALYNLGVLYAHTGKTDKAVEAWQKLIDLNPHSDAAHAAQQGIQQLKQVMSEKDTNG